MVQWSVGAVGAHMWVIEVISTVYCIVTQLTRLADTQISVLASL